MLSSPARKDIPYNLPNTSHLRLPALLRHQLIVEMDRDEDCQRDIDRSRGFVSDFNQRHLITESTMDEYEDCGN